MVYYDGRTVVVGRLYLWPKETPCGTDASFAHCRVAIMNDIYAVSVARKIYSHTMVPICGAGISGAACATLCCSACAGWRSVAASHCCIGLPKHLREPHESDCCMINCSVGAYTRCNSAVPFEAALALAVENCSTRTCETNVSSRLAWTRPDADA